MFNSLQPHGLQPARLLSSWDSPGKNTGAGCHALLQGIFPTQVSNSGLLHSGGFFTVWATRETLYALYTSTHTQTCAHTHTHMHVHACMYRHTCTHEYTQVYTCVWTHNILTNTTYARTCVHRWHTYAWTYTHTHVHIWTWVWANSRRQWRTGEPGMIQSTGSQRARRDWATEQWCAHIHIHVHSHTRMYKCIYTHIYVCENTYIYAWTQQTEAHIFTHAHTHVHTHTHIHVWAHIRICMNTINTCTRTHIYACTHTYMVHAHPHIHGCTHNLYHRESRRVHNIY